MFDLFCSGGLRCEEDLRRVLIGYVFPSSGTLWRKSA